MEVVAACRRREKLVVGAGISGVAENVLTGAGAANGIVGREADETKKSLKWRYIGNQQLDHPYVRQRTEHTAQVV